MIRGSFFLPFFYEKVHKSRFSGLLLLSILLLLPFIMVSCGGNDEQPKKKVETPVKKVEKSAAVEPEKLTWFVVGDKEKILSSLKELNMDEIIFVDPDGNPLQPSGKIESLVK